MTLRYLVNKVIFLKGLVTPRRLLNLAMKEIQFRLRSTTLWYFPDKISIDIGNVCNLSCPLCPTGQGANGAKQGFMELDLFKKIIDQIGRYLIKVELYNWGEPLLNKNLVPMILYTKERGIAVQISTNLMTLTEELADRLIATRIEKILVSCDGASAATYAAYRIGGDFDRLKENIRLLMNAKQRQNNHYTTVRLLFHVFRHNQHEVEKVKELAGDLGVDVVVRPMRTDMGKEVFETAHEAIQRDEKWIPTDQHYSAYDLVAKDKRKETVCHELWKTAVVNWDGSIFPCCAVYGDKYRFGEIRERSFKAAWNNESYRLARMELANKIKESPTVCHLCKKTNFLHF